MNTDQLAELRDALSTVVEALVEALDAIDGEPDLETADLPDDECTGDLEIQHDRELCASELGDQAWPETHGLGGLPFSKTGVCNQSRPPNSWRGRQSAV